MMKYLHSIALAAFLISVSAVSVQAQQNVFPAPEISLDEPYRYANQKCEFSFQLPEPPRRQTIWGDSSFPTRIVENTGHGEVGEELTYNVASLDDKAHFSVIAFCLYPPESDLEDIDGEIIERELHRIGERNSLKQQTLKAHTLPQNVSIGSVTGYEISEESDDVTAFYMQFLKGSKSMLLLNIQYSADQPQYSEIHDFILDSIVFER